MIRYPVAHMGALNTIRTSIAGPSLITVSLKTDAAILGKYSEIIIIIIIILFEKA